MAAVLLDTTVLIDFLRGRDETRRRLRTLTAAGDSLFTCAVNVEELARGLKPGEHDAAHRLVAGLRTVPLTAAEGWRAGEWRRAFAAMGQTLSQSDCLIAAAAHAAQARIATGNPRHFPFPEIEVEHWPAGA